MSPSLGRSLSRSDTLLLGICLVLSLTALLLPINALIVNVYWVDGDTGGVTVPKPPDNNEPVR